MPGSATADSPGRVPGRDGQRGRPRWRRPVAAAATAALLAALIVLGVAKIDLAQFGRAISHVNGWWVAASVLCMAGAFFARAESWYGALRQALPGERIGRPAVTRALLIGMAGSAVAPGRLGEAARAWLIARRAGVRGALATVVGTVLSQALLNLLALVLLTIVALAGSAIHGARTGSIVLSAAVPVLGIAALLCAPALLARTRRWRTERLRRVSSWVHAQLVSLRQGLVVFRRPGPAVHSGGFQLAAWALQLGACYTVLEAFGLAQRAGLPAAAAVLVAVNITAVLPVTPSSVGVFQAACIAVLARFGVSTGRGLAYRLVLQAVEVGCALGLGIPALLHEGISLSELRMRSRSGVSEPARSGY